MYIVDQLLSVNDLHGKIDVTAPNPNTLIVNVGDMVGGSSPVSALFQDEPTVELMESIGFDVGIIGNHELDDVALRMKRLRLTSMSPS